MKDLFKPLFVQAAKNTAAHNYNEQEGQTSVPTERVTKGACILTAVRLNTSTSTSS